MAKNDKINLPSSGGGLVRYFDDYKAKLEIPPEAVLVACGVIGLIVIFLHVFLG